VELSLRSRLRAGDQSAFGEIFDEHAGALHAYAARTLGDRTAAEDVVSLTFLEAWRLRGKLREDGDSVRPWLFGIATNVLRNTNRAARRHRAALGRMPARETVPDFADELAVRLDADAELAAAGRALARLRRGEREVVQLCVWSGLDYASAAEALGVPVGTVRSRLSRARARLRELAAKELELGRRAGQVRGGHGSVARSMQENAR
jgi:RNA polymerase sigma-70 factor (ECF subfamily)